MPADRSSDIGVSRSSCAVALSPANPIVKSSSLVHDSKGSKRAKISKRGVRYLNLKAISLACVIGLSTFVFSGCGNNNDNNRNDTTGNNGTNTSMKARSTNRGTAIDPMTGSRNGDATSNYRNYRATDNGNVNGNGNGTGNGRGGLFGTGIMNGVDENNMNGRGLFGNGTNNGSRNGNDMGMGNGNGTGNGRGGLFGTGIMNGVDEDNFNENGLFGNGVNGDRGGLFGTGIFNGNNDNNGQSGRSGTGMNGIRSNGAGTSDSIGQSGRMSAQANRGSGNGLTTGLNDRSQEYNDALVLGNLVIIGIDGDTGLGRGASTQAGNLTGTSTQHVLHVTNPQAIKALERVKQQLELGNETQNTDKLAKDLAMVLKHAKEPSVSGKGRNASAGAAAGR